MGHGPRATGYAPSLEEVPRLRGIYASVGAADGEVLAGVVEVEARHLPERTGMAHGATGSRALGRALARGAGRERSARAATRVRQTRPPGDGDGAPC